MGYSGTASHTHGWEERKKRSKDDLAGLMESVSAARKSGLPVEIVPGGDTGTYNIDAESNGLTELQAGTFSGSSAGRATPPCIPTSTPRLR